jgi:hypothetical protein
MARDNPKIQANIVSSPLASSHIPNPKTPGPTRSPNPAMASKLKKAWRANGKGLSLRQFARKHELGKEWLANKQAFR